MPVVRLLLPSFCKFIVLLVDRGVFLCPFFNCYNAGRRVGNITLPDALIAYFYKYLQPAVYKENYSMFIQIDDEVALELLGMQHAAALFGAIESSRDHLSAFLPWVGNMQQVEDCERYISNCIQLYQQKKEVSFVMLQNDAVVGRIGVHYIDLFNKSGAIGYWIAAAAAGRGIALRSCSVLTGYGFRELGLHRLEIKAAVHNLKSRAIPEKLGYTQEGLLRQAELVGEA